MERLIFEDPKLAAQLFGPQNLHLQILSRASGARIFNRGSTLCIESQDQTVENCLVRLFCSLYDELKEGLGIDCHSLESHLNLLLQNAAELDDSEPAGSPRQDRTFRRRPSLADDTLPASSRTTAKAENKSERKPAWPGLSRKNPPSETPASSASKEQLPQVETPKKLVLARNAAQKTYLELLKSHEIVFATGPAGTGKTYLAVAHAVHLLTIHAIKKIILTRPAVEAGEKLGFLPGDLIEKINPYLRPLYDALYDMLPMAKVTALSELGSIEIAPLAFMRGRTLNDSCIILDEAQNTTCEQMKMFLTRMGFGSRMIITGDCTQIDLPSERPGVPRMSGLVHARSILAKIPAIAFHTFSKEDVVRHQLVGEIVNAYDIAENRQSKA
ncbi:MAG: PhoH family protein [Desulfovibrio sp.]|nr:PhoH family protein [Desulfovibrio sp.]